MPDLIWGVMSPERAVFVRNSPAAVSLLAFFTDMLQMGNQDHNSHRNIQPDFRCNLFFDPLETARPGAAVFYGHPTARRALIFSV